MMAELIVDTTGGILDARATGELVRCRDCRWGKAVGQIGCVRFEDRANPDGNTSPDGFCAWAEGRGGEAR
jgi:hypothetical protein